MHECLGIPEILDLIMRCIPPEPVTVTARRHLVSCALVSRYFSDVALDIIWHTQTNLFHLLKTLPTRRWRDLSRNRLGIVGDYARVFTIDVPAPLEWTRLTTFYASRIRRIAYLPSGFHRETYDLPALRKICDELDPSSSSPIFPNLLKVEFVRMEDAYPCLNVFLRTKGISLSLQWADSTSNDIQMAKHIYPAITKSALHMHELDLGSVHLTGGTKCDSLSNLVCRMTQLRGLACGVRKLRADALHHLAVLPGLRKLDIVNNADNIVDAVRKVPRAVFPSLRHLTMRESGDMASFTALINQMNPQLHTLTLHFDKIPGCYDVNIALGALAKRSDGRHTLREVSLKYTWPGAPSHNRWRRLDETTLKGTVDRHTLEPLCSFPFLTKLVIDLPWNFNLGDADIEIIAQAWTRLRILKLGSMQGWGKTSLLTPNGLLALLKACRKLEQLSIQFDATISPPSLNVISQDIVNRNVDYLFVGASPISYSTIVQHSSFLRRLFPRLIGIGGCWLSLQDPEPQLESGSVAMHVLWEKVVDGIRGHR